ncbi:MAG TPA: hypothetical protein VMH81_20830 [Bryobacteraceae bacterium]|nr:hypothetical protein [Bryobacteraceae bacterium]
MGDGLLQLAAKRHQIVYPAVELGQLLNSQRLNLAARHASTIAHRQDLG